MTNIIRHGFSDRCRCCVLLCTYFALILMARKRSIGICDQTWSALLIAVGGPCRVVPAFR